MTKLSKACDLKFRERRLQLGQEDDNHVKQFTDELSCEMRFVIALWKISNLTMKEKLNINCNADF